MTDFWLSSGHHLTDRDAGGGLVATDLFLKAYLARPEIAPPPEACAAETRLHAALLADPRRPVGADEIAAMADPDARENWQVMITFRDHLLGHRTLEAAYRALAADAGRTPPIFLDHLVHVILRSILDGCADSFVVRAAELFFRPQRMAIRDGALLAADDETIAGMAPPGLPALMALPGAGASAQIDVLTEENAPLYWARSDRFDMALDLTTGRRGVDGLAKAIELWIEHMLSIEVAVEPLRALRDAPFTWYVGLDAEGTRIGDALWRGGTIDEDTQRRIAALFRLTFGRAGAEKGGDAVYLILAMTGEMTMRMKPQNLLTGLPARSTAALA